MDFTLETGTNTDYTITATDGNAGGIVGTMGIGATLNVTGLISSGEITATGTGNTQGYAGGVVGYATDATVNFGADTSVAAIVNGSSGTGGVFGYYNNTQERTFDVSTYSIDCTLNGKNNGGLFGELKNSNTISINGITTEYTISLAFL